ncbi:MAG: hypothetical protein M3R17_17110 [Bacteroidota bacterium]|nr:hypothetical protein [Bacteroidota bacterium]
MLQKAENNNLPFFNLSFFEEETDLPSSLRRRISTLKRQLREDLKGRKNLRLMANKRAEAIFNLRDTLFQWLAYEGEPVSELLKDTQAMVHSFNRNDQFKNIANILQLMLTENEPVMEAMERHGMLDNQEPVDAKKNAYTDMKRAAMNLPVSFAQIILDGIQGTCYLEYVSIAVMDNIETGAELSSYKISQLESIANAGLKQKRKFNAILLRSMAEDETKNEKSEYQDLSLAGLANAYSVEEVEYDYSMLISRNPKFKA